MREILFRGKQVDNGEWVEGWLCSSTFLNNTITTILVPCEIFGFDMVAVDPKTVGQFTGLTDKNGKKIFEGDIVKDVDTDINYQVIYEKNSFIRVDNQRFFYWNFDLTCLEVIGNIHDNPELLKGGDENA